MNKALVYVTCIMMYWAIAADDSKNSTHICTNTTNTFETGYLIVTGVVLIITDYN